MKPARINDRKKYYHQPHRTTTDFHICDGRCVLCTFKTNLNRAWLLICATISLDIYLHNHLQTKGIPDPDILIRTGNTKRLSNFLLWQLAYTELYFPDLLWPDFGNDEFEKALLEYSTRTRRFGDTSNFSL